MYPSRHCLNLLQGLTRFDRGVPAPHYRSSEQAVSSGNRHPGIIIMASSSVPKGTYCTPPPCLR